MLLASPQFLLLIPVFAVAGWFFPELQLWKPLRVLFTLLLILALCDPQIDRAGRGMDLWVLVDRSLSADAAVDRNLPEWHTLLERSRPSRHDHIHWVDYAAEVVAEQNAETSAFPGGRSQTRTRLALSETLARAAATPDRHHRFLLFTDGFSTEPLDEMGEKMVQAGIPLDYRLASEGSDSDYRVVSVEMPERVQRGEPFLVDIAVAGSPDGTVPCVVRRGDREVLEREIEIVGGRGRLRFSDRIADAGSHEYLVRLAPENDAFPGNNEFTSWLEIASGPRILLASRYPDDPLRGILGAQGFEVKLVTDTLSLQPGMLTGAKAVVLNNVPAHEIPVEFLDALDFYVTEQGGGLLMCGGQQSFGSGGYYESPVDALLPVTMELKNEHRKLAVAMAIVLDRSGSMAATVDSGHTKMDLANQGAARAVELLGNMDGVTVFAVDSSAHQVAPLLNVGTSRGELIDRIRGVQSMGGGIFVHTALKAAWEELKKAPQGQRHVILFSDAADSEEPGKYKSLIAEMRKEGATLSVIGLGSRSDPDATLLEDIAKRGEGRIFFSRDAGDLPNLFAQETVTVARSTFVEDPTGTAATGGWFELAGRDLDWPPAVDGYNLSYLRKGDSAALLSKDDYRAPLVAFGRRGTGRSAAVSFPLGGDFSAKSRNWEQAGDFVQTLARWLMGERTPPGIGLQHRLAGTELKLDLLFEPGEWAERFARRAPRVVLERRDSSSEPRELTWERLAPGQYSLRTQVEEGEVLRGAVQLDESVIPLGPLAAGTRAEWAFDSERVEELRQLSALSGGRRLLDLESAWEKPTHTARASIAPWIIALLVPLFLLEALFTRTGWRLPRFAPGWPGAFRSRKRGTAAQPSAKPPRSPVDKEKDRPGDSAKSPHPTASTTESEEPAKRPPESAAPTEEEQAAARRSRFAKAKKR